MCTTWNRVWKLLVVLPSVWRVLLIGCTSLGGKYVPITGFLPVGLRFSRSQKRKTPISWKPHASQDIGGLINGPLELASTILHEGLPDRPSNRALMMPRGVPFPRQKFPGFCEGNSLLFTTVVNHRRGLAKITSSVREAGVSRHNGRLIKGLPQTPQYGGAVMIRGVSGSPHLGPHDAERR